MDKAALRSELEALCQEVGEFILGERRQVRAGQIETKSLNSLVSYVDQEAEKKLVKRLKQLLPEAGFVAEEGTEQYKAERYNWIVDPLDGTTNFLYDLPIFAISIALVEKDEPIVGVVYELGQQEMFSAALGEGATCNGEPMRVADHPRLKDSLIATGFPYYDFNRLEAFNQLLAHLYINTRGVRRLGSAATDLAYVAKGRFNAFFEYGLSPWDVAAGILLVTEAGGRVSDFSGTGNYLYGGEIIASSQAIFNEFLPLVKDKMVPN